MPGIPDWLKKAPLVGAFFLFGAPQPLPAADCGPPQATQTVTVRHVHDGDTLVLSDNRRVRLIGINTPEVGADGKPGEPLALQARDHLRRLLFQHRQTVNLLPGSEAKDRHGRLLAHLWLEDGRNIASQLLAAGLGWYIAVPPNVRLIDCYRQAENQARADGQGIWRTPATAVHDADRLGLRATGFKLVRGRVIRVNQGGGATWLNLEGRFAVRIPDHALQWFPRPPDSSWIGRQIEVRGWLYRAKGELRVNVGHPAALHTLSTAP